MNFFTKKMKISNDTTIYQRIRDALKFEKISVNGLSKTFDMVQTTLNKQLRGDTPLPITTLLLVLSVLSDRISLEWLMTGEGTMLKSENMSAPPSDNTISKILEKNESLIRDNERLLIELNKYRPSSAVGDQP